MESVINILFKLLGGLHKIYPVKLYIMERLESYFFNYHVAQILDEASKIYSIGKYWKVKELINYAPFRGTLSELVRVGEFYPSPKDIAVAINVSISAYCNEECTDKDNIIDLAFHISQELKFRFISDQLLKTVFEDLNKDLDKLITDGKRSDINMLFSNKKELFTSYYSTFSKPEFSYSIKIWHQSQENSFIQWEEEDAITVNLNPIRIREGFFQVGFDYFCISSQSRLQRATRYKGFEFFDGDSVGDVIWAL